MNYFITRKQPTWQNPEVTILDNFDKFYEMVKNTDLIGGDSENNSLHVINANPLLTQFSDSVDSFVLDTTTLGTKYLQGIGLERKEILAHNGQYDYMIWKYHYGVECRRIKDTMVHEQVLGRGSGRSASLENTHSRRLGFELPVPKTTRNDFSEMGLNPIFEEDHILYSAYDPLCLFPIYEKQKPLIEQYKLGLRIYDIANPLIPVLGDMCLNGFTLNEEKWRKILLENKTKKFETEIKLDEFVKEFSKTHAEIRHGIWTRKRRKADIEQIGLFGTSTTFSNENVGNISYSSNPRLVKLFKVLGEPIPQKASKDEFGKTVDSFAEEALEQYKIERPDSKVIPFINVLLEYRGYEKAINSFGEIFLNERIKKGKSRKYKIGYKNNKTGKVHTIYKGEFTKNGRLSSGDVKIGFFNSQQIIKDNKYRNSFTLTPEEIAQGWYITTLDLSGAELVILASNSRDRKLIKLLKEGADLHSYLATAIYTKIFQYILNTMTPDRALMEITELLRPNRLQHDLDKTDEELEILHKERIAYVLANKSFIVDKNNGADLRNPVKNIVYGISYGAAKDKVAETLNIAIFYAELAIEAMRAELPDAFAYLDKISKFGVKNGFVVFNERTNSRHWFKEWLDAKEWGKELTGKQKGSIGRACKNYGISGTQADMIKEGIVNVDKYRLENVPDFFWLMQVHDEIVFKHKDKDAVFVPETPKKKAYYKSPVADKVSNIISTTCNLYLNDIEMGVDGHTLHYWSK